ncbi:MAG: hypothetical protein AAGK97_02940 [Bacteroidota bacterium]
MKRSLYLFAAVLFLFSCKPEEDPKTVININKEFNIELIEMLHPETNQLAFKISTIERQDCENAEIIYTSAELFNAFRLQIEGVERPDSCIDNPSTIESQVPFELPSNNLDINIKISDVVSNKGLISVSENLDIFQLTMESDHGIRIVKDILFSVPKGFVWGYIGTNNPQVNVAFDPFNQELSGLTSDAFFSEGNYGHFEIDGSGKIDQILNKPVLSDQILFIKRLDGDKETLDALVQEFRTQYGTDLVIKVFTSEGEIF